MYVDESTRELVQRLDQLRRPCFVARGSRDRDGNVIRHHTESEKSIPLIAGRCSGSAGEHYTATSMWFRTSDSGELKK